MMRRDQALEVLARHRRDDIVIPTMTTVGPWRRIGPSPYNLFHGGFMGGASTLGLGIALGDPSQRVWVLDGDGSLLMQLGSLATIAGAAPPNFYHFLFNNGVHETSGGQPVPNSGRLDWAGMARAAGYAAVYHFSGLEDLETGLESALSQPGPVFIVLDIEQEPGTVPSGGADTGADARALKELLANKKRSAT